ncbi:vacuolar protein sorting-associated protein 26 [Oesophagostomum dentatum]|uniref:Vacuolar protein sorting-associated protein 26 n=1 Tax=Oesophagostomum dentatum TaxID=61180 RepID=A0A0B1S512_OESDE|nr:vacuolar protein sorting-associated protein 26 [Oesophagostomum dentatum]
MALFGFGQSADITIKLDDEDTRKTAKIRGEDGQQETHYLFYDGETISGTVNIALKKANQKLEHQGIRIEFIGQIEVYYDRGNQQDFISLTKDLARPGELTQNSSFHFEFHNVEKPYESYMGINVKLRRVSFLSSKFLYFLRVTIVRRITDITREMDLIVHTLSSYPDADVNLKMDVGIEDCLHIEFEYNKSRLVDQGVSLFLSSPLLDDGVFNRFWCLNL